MSRSIPPLFRLLLTVLLAGATACAARLPPVPAGETAWVWSGAVTDSSALVKARVPDSATAELQVDDASTGTLVARVAGTRTRSDGDVFAFALADLAPATAFRYRVTGSTATTGTGTFRTFPSGPGRFSIAFASCASTGSNARVFDAIRAAAPDLFIHMGDFHYEDIARDAPELFRHTYERALRSPRQGALYRAVPIAYVWDDHDFGGDDSDVRSPSSRAAHEVYREMVPHYSLAPGDGSPIHQAFDIGRVRVLLTDVRTARTPVPAAGATRPSLLGEAQLAWLLAQFEDASRRSAPVLWVNVVPWITRADERTHHGWAPWAAERQIIADAIERLGLTRRLVILSGDAHMLALDDGTNSQYATNGSPPGPVVMHAAPLDRWPRRKGGPFSHGTSVRNQQFGLLTIDDDGTTITMELSGRDRYNEQVGRLHLVLQCADGACTEQD